MRIVRRHSRALLNGFADPKLASGTVLINIHANMYEYDNGIRAARRDLSELQKLRRCTWLDVVLLTGFEVVWPAGRAAYHMEGAHLTTQC